jgi:hypothetical protein
MWWLTHSRKIDALKLTYGGVTHLTQVVVVALLTWELGQLIIYGASGEVTLNLNMVAKVTQVIIRHRGRRENPMLNRPVVVAMDEGRRWHGKRFRLGAGTLLYLERNRAGAHATR